MNEFGDLLKSIRKDKGFTQEAIAARMGISRQAYSRFERSRISPPAKTLWRIADALEIDRGELMLRALEAMDSTIDMGDGIKHPVGVAYWVSDEEDLLNNYRRLNEDGKGKVRKYTEDLAGNQKYQAAAPDPGEE